MQGQMHAVWRKYETMLLRVADFMEFDIAHSRISSYPYGHIKTAEERGECHVEKHLFAAGLQ